MRETALGGPKRALWGFAADVLGDDAVSLFTNHPKVGELPSFNHALCGLYAAGVGPREASSSEVSEPAPSREVPPPGEQPLPGEEDRVRVAQLAEGVPLLGQAGEAKGILDPLDPQHGSLMPMVRTCSAT